MGKIALGLMRIAEMSIDEVEKLVLDSIEAGIDFFDLADIYGRGKCETLFGEVILRHPEKRSNIYIQSKVGIIPHEAYDLSYDYIVNKTIESINRLHCGYLDSLLLHRPDILMDNKEVAKAIEYLQDEGYIRDFGVSNFSQSEIEYLNQTLKTPIKYNQVQVGLGNTDMLDQTMYTNIPSKLVSKESDSLFFFMKKEGITIQAWSPFQMGFFEGSIFNEEKYPEINECLLKYATKYQTSKCAIATKFLLMLDEEFIVVTGSTSIKHIQESLDGMNVPLTKYEWYDLYKSAGHMLP